MSESLKQKQIAIFQGRTATLYLSDDLPARGLFPIHIDQAPWAAMTTYYFGLIDEQQEFHYGRPQS